MRPQPGILAPLPPSGRFLVFGLAPDADRAALVGRLAAWTVGDDVLGVGAPLVEAPGLRGFPAHARASVVVPSTQGAIVAFLRDDDAGRLVHRAQALVRHLGPSVTLVEDVATFVHAGGRDLTGYVDGTENPKDARAAEVALDGARSFLSVQRWVHDLASFAARPTDERDALLGRTAAEDEELPDAPETAHVKRTAQESFDPPSFLVRRSMPFGDAREAGLFFAAFAASLDPFERILRRMVGDEDGVVDALFRFSRPVSGGHYLCPPIDDRGLLRLSP